jgi:hypothetical protein
MERPHNLAHLTPADLRRLMHASELLDAAHAALMETSLQAKKAIAHLLYEAQQEILHPIGKCQRRLARLVEQGRLPGVEVEQTDGPEQAV